MRYALLLSIGFLACMLSGCFKSVVVRPVIDVRDPIPRDAQLDDRRQDKGHPPVDKVRPERRLRKK